jgi:hypothetical protein
MMNKIRVCFIKLGLWYHLDLLRNTPGILRWLKSGCSGLAPNPIKLIVISWYLRRYSINYFIETGTYLGETLSYVAKKGLLCSSIELSKDLYEAACKQFKDFTNVTLIEGDSGLRIPELLEEVNAPVLFWLDGHYSHGITAKADEDTPISRELRAILNHHIKNHVILIDDARYFDGTNGYPHIDELLRLVKEDGSYCAEISTDIIRLVAKEV